ncbi:ankyrin repeat-containing protein [Emydomyces testavorans]|uniref:protein S-acyltransferase n=1 Tax=Emydomyces testavorans TaxID=2070801 RepID=A0AAF0DCM8_9EURO|nr:ankyrin repeat-containing protein [Emydomyces testavorans]
MASAQSTISLSFEAIDDLIYSARTGDLQSLQSDITNLSHEHNCSAASIVESAVDSEDESEGGTGACLLHWPAANGNIEGRAFVICLLTHNGLKNALHADLSPNIKEILKYLLATIRNTTTNTPRPSPLINHQNHSGNTPLHWAALNTHLECAKALVEAGADISAKNTAGHDAAFLAERSEWSTTGEDEREENSEGGATTITAGSASEPARPMSRAMRVVEYLLTYDKGRDRDQSADALESGPNDDGVEDEMEDNKGCMRGASFVSKMEADVPPPTGPEKL